MTAKRHTKTQIARILDEIRSGAKMVDVCRKYNVSRTTVHRWQKKIAARERQPESPEGKPDKGPTREAPATEAAALRQLQEENARLKRIVVRQALRIDVLEERLAWREE